MTYWGIIPAAGVGKRFNPNTVKQYTKINGKTLLELSINSLLQLDEIEQVHVVVSFRDQRWR